MKQLTPVEDSLGAIASVVDALLFAAEKHAGQRRKDEKATPYINHPLALVRALTVDGQVEDVEVLQAAALHDTIEDTDTAVEELVSRFGHTVASIVMEVTDDKSIADKQQRKQLQIESARNKSSRAALVKLADKICNVRDLRLLPPVGWSAERKKEYVLWARDVVSRLPQVSSRLVALFDEECELSMSAWNA